MAAKLFNLSENGIRVATTRLLNEGMIESVERGIYQLSPSTKDWAKVILNRKTGIKQTKEWQQHYLAVFTGTLGRIDRTALKKRERVLRQFGFKELETGIYIRPDNLAYSFEKTCEELVLAGLEKEAKIVLFSISNPQRLSKFFLYGIPNNSKKIMKCIVEISRTGLKTILISP